MAKSMEYSNKKLLPCNNLLIILSGYYYYYGIRLKVGTIDSFELFVRDEKITLRSTH